MDAKIKNLVAAGAAAAVNCRPCLDILVPRCIKTGASGNDIRDAIATGFQVSRNAHAKTQSCIDEIVTEAAEKSEAPGWEWGDEEAAHQNGCC